MTTPKIRLKDMLSPQAGRGPLARLVNETESHAARLELVRTLLPEQYASHCIAASVRGSELTIVADSSAWANRFRFEEKKIKEQCCRFSDLASVESVRFKTASQLRDSLAKEYKSDTNVPSRPVPQETIEHVIQLADSIEHAPLKRSLLKLADALRNRSRNQQQ